MARPKTGRYDNVVEELNKYTDETDIPILAEFCYQRNYTRDWLYRMAKDNEALDIAIKRCTGKKESVLERGALTGTLNQTMAIFSLKQLGWKDKIENDTHIEFESDGFIEAMKTDSAKTFTTEEGESIVET